MGPRLQPGVLWREGMFLFPQHLQAFARELGARLQSAAGLGLVGDWGLLELEIDESALAADVFSVKRAGVLFRDGTLFCLPENAVLEQREFAEHFKGPELQVYLGVPAAQAGVPQIGADSARLYRYKVLRQEIPDDNERDARREMELVQLQGRLFFGEEDRSGFESVPIARLARVGRPKVRSVLAPAYVPPVLCCSASKVLAEGLRNAATKARAQSRDLAARMPDIARLSSVEKGADISGLVKLQAVNQCVALLEQAAGQDTLHPYQAYQALVQSAGNLAVFAPGRVLPDLPAYQHADVNGCFRAAFEVVDALLAAEVAAPYDTSPFEPDPVKAGLWRLRLPAEWAGRDGHYFLAVEMADEPERVREMVAAGVKLVAEDEVDRVIQGVLPGIELRHLHIAPLSFPKRDALHYFAIESEGATRNSWLKVLESQAAEIVSVIGGPEEVRFHFYVEFRD
jgi:type VI secretion system protein ImpJ